MPNECPNNYTGPNIEVKHWICVKGWKESVNVFSWNAQGWIKPLLNTPKGGTSLVGGDWT